MTISNPLLKTSTILYVMIFIMALVIAGCTTRMATVSEGKYKTKLTGNYIIEPKFKYKFSALILKEYGNLKLVPGTIISSESNGVVFRAEEGYFKGENKLYKYKNIACVIDTNFRAIYGTMPDEYYYSWETTMTLTNARTGSIVLLNFEPNQAFEIYIKPGVYRLTDIQFRSGIKQLDAKRKFYHPITLIVQENKINSLGTIYVDSDSAKGDSLQFECLTEFSEFDDSYHSYNPAPYTASLPVNVLSSAAMAFSQPIKPARLPIYHTFTIVPDYINLKDSNVIATKFIKGNY